MTKREKLLQACSLLEKAAVLLDEVGYVGAAELARDCANDVEVAMSKDPEIEAA